MAVAPDILHGLLGSLTWTIKPYFSSLIHGFFPQNWVPTSMVQNLCTWVLNYCSILYWYIYTIYIYYCTLLYIILLYYPCFMVRGPHQQTYLCLRLNYGHLALIECLWFTLVDHHVPQYLIVIVGKSPIFKPTYIYIIDILIVGHVSQFCIPATPFLWKPSEFVPFISHPMGPILGARDHWEHGLLRSDGSLDGELCSLRGDFHMSSMIRTGGTMTSQQSQAFHRRPKAIRKFWTIVCH